MKLWLDGQLSPSLVEWLAASFAIEASADLVRRHGAPELVVAAVERFVAPGRWSRA